MAHAEKCPICEGEGWIYSLNNPKIRNDMKCPGCQGKGWVEVSNEPEIQLKDWEIPKPIWQRY